MELVNDHMAIKARALPTTDDGFLVLAGEVGDWRGPFASPPRELPSHLATLTEDIDAQETTVFRAVLRPPGEGDELLAARGIRPARFDVVVLIRTESVDAALAVRDSPAYRKLAETLGAQARRTHEIVARNAGRLGDVDHGRDDRFLFNYFYADDRETLLQVWQYTAGWFQAKTALPNSALMQPLEHEPADYGLINHASWPHWRTFLPSLIFRPTFRSFVLANFKANGIAAQPIIYRKV
ncbi:hypothetical protein IU474_31320 [Nocardia otitidiscaviarum]|uniref:hypothetical protein n=1 Tax=Nocardia otitidiscaviarum TaxID=1823 RepID=UPI0018953D04|nr:hypothetical protein [Nocardia otitidiscaviarum]MBF6241535.1 hypothetical protein [Nocardia otitidiscaviarum]